jgi:putative flippase GtrA
VSIITNSRERGRFMRFAVVGLIGAVVDFGVANLLTTFFHVALTPAGIVSFIAAIISNFTWNRFWTYPDSRSKNIVRQLTEFSVVSVVGLLIRVPVLEFLKPQVLSFLQGLSFELPFFSTRFYANNITLATAVIIVMFWNFFVNRYWTYRDVDQRKTDPLAQ